MNSNTQVEMADFAERSVKVAGNEIKVIEGGEGPPLIIFHEELGHPGWLRWHREMARTRRLVIPIHPGFQSARIDWINGVRDLACLYGFLLRDEKLEGADAIGFSLGGWIAAEMAVGNPRLFRRLALVAPFGIKPSEGYIMDMFPMTSADYLKASVADYASTPDFDQLYGEASAAQFERWEDARTECARLGWEPYMFNPSLVPLLAGLSGLPTLVVSGDKDKILPASAARAYARAIPGARLHTIAGAGHRPEFEKPDEFLGQLREFLK